MEPDIKKFPKRNRIIAGLSDKVLVIEAEYRSGSSITIKYAKKQGKIVYAIPSNIYSYSGIGTNIMIQNGAKLVMKSDEIIDDIKEKYKFTNKKNIEEKYIPIYKLLSEKPIHINEIARKLNKNIQDIIPTITMMELNEYIFQVQSNYFVRKE